MLDVFEHSGFVAPAGDVEKVLDIVAHNVVVTGNLDSRIELPCGVLLTSEFELFSMQESIVTSRGLLDVVKNEETLAALRAFEMTDVRSPTPAQEEHGFSDSLRLAPTEALEKRSFVNTPDEAMLNGKKAIEWLSKSPCAGNLANAGREICTALCREY